MIRAYVSIIRRSAACASWVIESASSRMIILYGGHGYFTPSAETASVLGVCLAKFFIFSLTMEIPRSSEAFNSSTRARKLSGLHIYVSSNVVNSGLHCYTRIVASLGQG